MKKQIERCLADVKARKRAYQDERAQTELSPERKEALQEIPKVLKGEREELRAAMQDMVDKCYEKLREVEQKLYAVNEGNDGKVQQGK